MPPRSPREWELSHGIADRCRTIPPPAGPAARLGHRPSRPVGCRATIRSSWCVLPCYLFFEPEHRPDDEGVAPSECDLDYMSRQAWVVRVTQRATRVEKFRTRRIELGAVGPSPHQIWISQVRTANGHGIRGPARDGGGGLLTGGRGREPPVDGKGGGPAGTQTRKNGAFGRDRSVT